MGSAVLLRLSRLALALAFSLARVSGARGDEVQLRDGRRLEGDILRRDKRGLVLKTGLGQLTFDAAEVVAVTYGPTRAQLFEERWKASSGAPDFFELGTWAAQVKLRSAAKRAMRRVVELDADHAGAHAFLGHVLYRGEWLSERERDRRAAADAEAERRAAGLVPYGDSWVTPEDKERLDAGLVRVNGEWMEYGAAQRLRGLEEYLGQWLPREEALARRDVLQLAMAAGVELPSVLTAQALVAGEFPVALLEEVGAGLGRGYTWFGARFSRAGTGTPAGGGPETESTGDDAERGLGQGGPGDSGGQAGSVTESPDQPAAPGADPLGARRARVVLLARDADVFGRAIEHCAPLGRYLPEGWATAVRRTHGFYWWNPAPLSVARQGERGDVDIIGHSYHQWGHLIANLEGDDGRLLPPWYDEGLASLMEFNCHGQNRVFCRGSAVATPASGTTAARADAGYDRADLRRGRWRKALIGLLEKNAVRRFDKLAGLQFGELTEIDTAAAMGLLSWLETRSPGALGAFHAVLRRGAPPAPGRVDPDGHARGILYDEAFTAAAGMVRQEADKAWRAWILTQ